MEVIDIVCPRAVVFYNCSFYTDSRVLTLTWHITYPEQAPVTIMYDHQSTVDSTQTFSNNIQSSLTRYRTNEYVESLMSLEFRVDIGPTVQCTVDTLTSELSLPVHPGKVTSKCEFMYPYGKSKIVVEWESHP